MCRNGNKSANGGKDVCILIRTVKELLEDGKSDSYTGPDQDIFIDIFDLFAEDKQYDKDQDQLCKLFQASGHEEREFGSADRALRYLMETGTVMGMDKQPIAMGSSACSQPTGWGISLLTILQYRKPRKTTVMAVDIIAKAFICAVSFCCLIACYGTEL